MPSGNTAPTPAWKSPCAPCTSCAGVHYTAGTWAATPNTNHSLGKARQEAACVLENFSLSLLNLVEIAPNLTFILKEETINDLWP